MSSSFSGTAKTEKQSSKFKGIDINTIYKGSSASPPKTTTTSRHHGLQVLGKVQSVRRMPPPANLPSLKSQSGGNNPNVNLVPAGTTSAGWSVTKEEKKTSTTTTTLTTSAVQKSLQQQQAGGPSSHPHQMENHSYHRRVSQGEEGVLWSDVTSGGRNQKSFSLQEDFPELSAGGEERNYDQPRREDGSRDQQYGLGPSLRPQNVASWRDGGGKGIAQHPPRSPQSQSPSPQRRASEDSQCAGQTHQQGSPEGMRPPGVVPSMMRMAFVGGPMPMMSSLPGHPYPPRPHMMMMPPPYAFRSGFHPPPPYHPNFIPPGMPRHPFMAPEFGMRPRMPQAHHPPSSPTASFSSGSAPDGKDRPLRSSVIKERDLEQFDKLEISEGSGWARSSVDVDYSEKLVFSDDEDGPDASSGRKSKIHSGGANLNRSHKWASQGWSEEEEKGRMLKQDDFLHSSSSASFKYPERSAGEERPNSVGLLPGDGSDVYAHPPFVGPYGRRLVACDRQWPHAPMNYDRRPFPPGPPYGVFEMFGGEGDPDDDDEKCREQSQNKQEPLSAIERARQRREEEERKLMEHQKSASMLKLKQLDEKIKKALCDKERNEDEEENGKDAVGEKSGNMVSLHKLSSTSTTSLSSNGAKFIKSQSQQSMDHQSSPDPLERPDSSPCPPSFKPGSSVPTNPPAYPGGASHRAPLQPPFGYWGGSYDPRWRSVPFHPAGYGAMEQTARFRTKGQLEHSGSLDDLQQNSVMSKRPLPAPPQPHNYYQYHPHNYMSGDPYEGMHFVGEYKDVYQRGPHPRDNESRTRSKPGGGQDDASYRNDDVDDRSNVDACSYSGPRKILHPSRPSPTEPPQRKTILHRKKSESDRSEDRALAGRERMCSTSSGVSSKAEEVACRDTESIGSLEGRQHKPSYHESHQDVQKAECKFEDDKEGDPQKKSNGRQQQLQKYRDDRADSRMFQGQGQKKDDVASQNADDEGGHDAGRLQSSARRKQHHRDARPLARHLQNSSEDDGLKSEVSGKDIAGGQSSMVRASDLSDEECKKNEKNKSVNADNPRVQERKPKPRERQIYQHQQWNKSAAPPPGEQNFPGAGSSGSLKKQPAASCDASACAASTDSLPNKKDDRKSLSKESLKSDKREMFEEVDRGSRNDNRGTKKSTGYGGSAYEHKEAQRRQKRPDYYDTESYSCWKSEDKESKEYYSKRGGGRGNKGARVGRNEDSYYNKESRSTRNCRGSNVEGDLHPKEEHDPSRDGRLASRKDFYGNKERDDGCHGMLRNNRKSANDKSAGKSLEQKLDWASDETVERNSKKEVEVDARGHRQAGKDEGSKVQDGEKNGELASKKTDSAFQGDSNVKQAAGVGNSGRPRTYRGGKGREYMDSGDYHGEDRYRPQGSREFVRGGSKHYSGRGGRDHPKVWTYVEDEDDEWEDERVAGGRNGGRYSTRFGGGRRNPGRRTKTTGKDVQDSVDRQKRGDGKKSAPLKDVHLSEDLKKTNEVTGTSKNGSSSTEGIPSLMSKPISPPAMAKMSSSLQLLSDNHDRQKDVHLNDMQHGKQGKEGRPGKNSIADEDQEKNSRDEKHFSTSGMPSYQSSNLAASPNNAASASAASFRQPHFHRFHHQYHPVNNYDRRPRSSRGPTGSGRKTFSGENKPSSSNSTDAKTNESGSHAKDKKQSTSDAHNEEWETASEGSEVMTGGPAQKTFQNESSHQNVRHQPIKESNGENASGGKRNFGASRSTDKNSRRPVGHGGFAHRSATTNKNSQGEEMSMGRSQTQSAAAEKFLTSTSTSGRIVSNDAASDPGKAVEGSSGDGDGTNYGGAECRDVPAVDGFPSTAGDGGGKDAQVYFLHEVLYDDPDLVRPRRNWLMKIIDPWSSPSLDGAQSPASSP